jgi:hypothetical protein
MLAVARRKLIRPSPYRFPGTKPGFDSAHPASAGMASGRGVSILTFGGGFVDLLSGNKLTPTGAWTAGVQANIGATLNTSSTGYVILSSQSTASLNNNLTAAFIFTASAVATEIDLLVFQISGSKVIFISSGVLTSYDGSAHATALGVTVGVPYFVIVSQIGGVANWFLTNLNTGQLQTATSAWSWTGTQTGVAVICGGASHPWNGAFAAGMFSPALLSPAQCVAWSADPWSFWYPQ